MQKEAGGHRIQRIPPTEKRGRVHTSTVTVSVIDPNIQLDTKYSLRGEDHYRFEWFSGTGAGGAHRNKSKNCSRVIHIPTGIKQEVQGRKREANKKEALAALNKILDNKASAERAGVFGAERKEQVGSGMRGDKFRTYRVQEDQVIDHRTGARAKCSKVMRGRFDLLH